MTPCPEDYRGSFGLPDPEVVCALPEIWKEAGLTPEQWTYAQEAKRVYDGWKAREAKELADAAEAFRRKKKLIRENYDIERNSVSPLVRIISADYHQLPFE